MKGVDGRVSDVDDKGVEGVENVLFHICLLEFFNSISIRNNLYMPGVPVP